MTEQPVEPSVLPRVQSEQEFLGNHPHILAPGSMPEIAVDMLLSSDAFALHEQAEGHARQALFQLENGELNAGIAWLQAALAFALNGRHAAETSHVDNPLRALPFLAALAVAEREREGDSNDREIRALWEAVEAARTALGVTP